MNDRTRLTRRQLIELSVLTFLGLISSPKVNAMQDFVNPHSKSGFKLGTTFSQLQCYYLGLDYQDAFRQICDLGFDYIRLCSYWHELEAVENQFDFKTLDWLLEESDRREIKVILTVGMKAPRWPEFHFPKWLEAYYDTRASDQPIDRNPTIAEHALKLIDAVVSHTRDASSVHYWQVENEPFVQFEITGGRFLSPKFVQQEVELVRSLARSQQKILLTAGIHLPNPQPADDQAFDASRKLADAVGINVYTKVPDGKQSYLEPTKAYWRKLQIWQQVLQDDRKESWIAEAQAEPWEPNELVPVRKINYPSSSPVQASELVRSVAALGYGTGMLWGCEYWYWSQKKGRSHWWDAMQNLAHSRNA
jgi:Beta-galactosidase